jgi:Flp pilus assembly protein TadG
VIASPHAKGRQPRNGQALALFIIAVPVLLMFAGLAIDFGLAYVTKTTLSRAVDAAALAAMRNVNQGQAEAIAIGQSAFSANYQSTPGRDASPPAVSIVFTTDASNNTVVNVNATVAMNTFLLRIAGFNTLNISSSAQATRPKLIMALPSDVSGSMNNNGGAQALPPALLNFLGYFDNERDEVSFITFSSAASVKVPITTNFMNPITDAVDALAGNFGGATFSTGGLLDAQAQINSVPVAQGEDVVKAVVFFTDGWANTVQGNLNCPASTLLNFGGCAPQESGCGWGIFDPVTGNPITSCNATKFSSTCVGAGTRQLNDATITAEATCSALQAAASMRAQNVVVYSIGLGNDISKPFLQQIANDPASSTYDANQPVGEAVFAPTAADLQSVFQTIASKLLLRLSR